LQFILDAAGPDLAPGCFFIFPASGAASLEIRPAGAAIESAKGDKVFVFNRILQCCGIHCKNLLVNN
jgi:hypothetical protein